MREGPARRARWDSLSWPPGTKPTPYPALPAGHEQRFALNGGMPSDNILSISAATSRFHSRAAVTFRSSSTTLIRVPPGRTIAGDTSQPGGTSSIRKVRTMTSVCPSNRGRHLDSRDEQPTQPPGDRVHHPQPTESGRTIRVAASRGLCSGPMTGPSGKRFLAGLTNRRGRAQRALCPSPIQGSMLRCGPQEHRT
jgi:hypothetical protein